MLAPIAPALAEECWETLHTKVSESVSGNTEHPLCRNGGPSIFAHGFPRFDKKGLAKTDVKQQCAVQRNGNLMFATSIARPPVDVIQDPSKLRQYVLDYLRNEEVGKEWLLQDGKMWKYKSNGTYNPIFETETADVPEGWNLYVIRGGRTINFVTPKEPKTKQDPKAGTKAEGTSTDDNQPARTEELKTHFTSGSSAKKTV